VDEGFAASEADIPDIVVQGVDDLVDGLPGLDPIVGVADKLPAVVEGAALVAFSWLMPGSELNQLLRGPRLADAATS
jgi:hypothetical protein